MTPGKVYFIGAGPGDPELLTLKAARLIAGADLVLYAGSLVPRAVVAGAKPGAAVIDSAPLNLEETHALMRGRALEGGTVARVHTGDPGLYGAVREQARLLDADGIPWEVVPGVTAAFAAAAAAGVSLTEPGGSQSLIITRNEGRTPVPANERLRELAARKTTLAIYLSAAQVEILKEELLAALPPETPVICAHRVGWPDQEILRLPLGELERAKAFTRQTVFLVMPGGGGGESRLYSADFRHGFRP